MKRVLILLILMSFIFAGQTITGSTGYITMPNADGMRYQEYSSSAFAFGQTDSIQSHWKYNASLFNGI